MMERRMALAIVAAAVASPAFAQAPSARTDRDNANSPDEQYIRQTMAVGSLSLALSRLAEEKARFPKLKEFSQFETAEQETMANVLNTLQNPRSANGNVPTPPEAEVEQHIDTRGRDMLQKLRSAQAGRDFDVQYLDAEVDGHDQLLHIQEQFLMSGRNADFLNVAKLARGMIREHLQLLADIKMEMGQAATTGTAPGRR